MITTGGYIHVTPPNEFKLLILYNPLREGPGGSIFATHTEGRQLGDITRYWNTIQEFTKLILKRICVQTRYDYILIYTHAALHKLLETGEELSLIDGYDVRVIKLLLVYEFEKFVDLETIKLYIVVGLQNFIGGSGVLG